MKKLLYLAALLPLLFACSQEEGLENASVSDSDVINKVSVTVLPLDECAETRTTMNNSGTPQFVWASNDSIGIFSDKGNQMGFSMANGAGSTAAEFDGGGWGLKASSTYAAYYPLIGNFYLKKTAIPLDYTGQIQNGQNNTDHLGKYDFLSAPASNPQNGNVNFTFDHLGSLLRFQFVLPEAAEVSSIILKTDGLFTEKAMLNLTTNKVTPTTTSTTQTLLLDNVNVPRNSIHRSYMMIAPVDLTNHTLEAYVTSATGEVYMADLGGQNFVKGTVYTFAKKMTKSEHTYVDLGITDSNGKPVLWATTNLGAFYPWDCGGYYAWGETKAYNDVDTSNIHNNNYYTQDNYRKTDYTWETYKWATSIDEYSISKYSFADGELNAPWYQAAATYIGLNGVQNQRKLEPEDDAATANWGNGWRIPTSAELDQLKNNCYWKWVTEYNGHTAYGFIVYKAKADADKGKVNGSSSASYSASTDAHIFLPAAGYRIGSRLYSAGSSAYSTANYWSSELSSNSYEACSYAARSLYFNSNYVSTGGSGRYLGQSIRPVRTEN